jgi:hypothetical protein
MKESVKSPTPPKKTTKKPRNMVKKPTFEIDKSENAIAEVVMELQSRRPSAPQNSANLVHRVTNADATDREFFNAESIQIVSAAKKHFKEINAGSTNKFGEFNTGFIITKNMLAELKKVPDFQGVLVCLAAFTAPNDAFIEYNGDTLGVNSLIFPVFRVVTSEGITEDFWCPAVPGCFPPPDLEGTIYYCPPLAPCPRKP